jgi:hypothetical protein
MEAWALAEEEKAEEHDIVESEEEEEREEREREESGMSGMGTPKESMSKRGETRVERGESTDGKRGESIDERRGESTDEVLNLHAEEEEEEREEKEQEERRVKEKEEKERRVKEKEEREREEDDNRNAWENETGDNRNSPLIFLEVLLSSIKYWIISIYEFLIRFKPFPKQDRFRYEIMRILLYNWETNFAVHRYGILELKMSEGFRNDKCQMMIVIVIVIDQNVF